MFLANSLGGAERRGIAGIFRTPATHHATRNCGMNSKFFMANACITAQIIVMPSRTSLSASGFLHHVADQFRSPAQNDLIAKNKASASTRDQQSEQTGDVVLDADRSIFSEFITQKSPGLGRGF
jgi:hypothetical protein